jgi:ankyrin repeat protein
MGILKRQLVGFLLPALTIGLYAAESNVSEQLYNAIRRDDWAAVQTLLGSGANVNLIDSRGRTPLMYAAAVGSETMMRRLIEAGADVNVRTNFGATALMWCSNSLVRVKLLVDHGADVNARSKQGHTPLLLASGHPGGLEIVKLLLSKGATFHDAVIQGIRPEQLPATGIPPDARFQNPLAAAAATNDAELITFLLDRCGPEMTSGPGAIALMSAAEFGNAELVRRLLAAGVNVNSQSPPVTLRVKNGPIAIGSLTALMVAAGGGNTETVQLLLEAKADVNARDVRGMTSLMLAAATDHPNLDIVRMVLAHGADTQIQSKAGETALDWALKFKMPAVIAAIREASPKLAAPRIDATASAGIAPLAAAPSAGASHGALARSLVLLQKSAATSFQEGGCISCHAGNIVSAAVASARRKGLAVDEDAAAEILRATRLQFTAASDGLLERSDPPASEVLSFALFALAEQGTKPDLTIDAMVHNFAAQQLGDGSWKYRGILRPPTSDSIFSNTALAIRVLKEFAPPARKSEFDERIARAVRALSAAEPVTTEDAVMQLLGLAWAGTDSAKLREVQMNVIALQRADGGWPQTPLLASDAYATGTALHALYESGMATNSPAYRKGVAFLLKTQAEDGSWHVVSRAPKFQPYFEGGFPYGHDQWISQWATGWAAIALAHALPEKAGKAAGAQDNRQMGASSPPVDSVSKREIMEIEREGREASLRNDVAFFERTMAPDYFGIGPNGDRVTKDEAIAERKSGGLRWDAIDASEEDVRLLGAVAIASGIWKVKGNLDGRDISGAVRYTRIWQKIHGKLILVHNQITSVRSAR